MHAIDSYLAYLSTLREISISRVQSLTNPIRDIFYGESFAGYFRRRLNIDIMSGLVRPKTPQELAFRLRDLFDTIFTLSKSHSI
jgi:hypothetical protein